MPEETFNWRLNVDVSQSAAAIARTRQEINALESRVESLRQRALAVRRQIAQTPQPIFAAGFSSGIQQGAQVAIGQAAFSLTNTVLDASGIEEGKSFAGGVARVAGSALAAAAFTGGNPVAVGVSVLMASFNELKAVQQRHEQRIQAAEQTINQGIARVEQLRAQLRVEQAKAVEDFNEAIRRNSEKARREQGDLFYQTMRRKAAG